jgi:8-oxo-dGTP diphosphatase
VLVFAFRDDRVVLADIAGRGWCIPSGRIEAGESPEAAARREAWEEAALAVAELIPLGSVVEIQKPGPDRLLALAYVGQTVRFGEFIPTAESRGVRLAARRELAECYYLWDALTESMFDAAWEFNRIIHEPSAVQAGRLRS